MRDYGTPQLKPYQCFMGRWEGLCKTFGPDGVFIESTAVHMDVYWTAEDTWHLHEDLGQTHLNFKVACDQVQEVALVPAGQQTPGLDAQFPGFVGLEQVEGDVAKTGEVFSRAAQTRARLILAEGNVQTPMSIST